jgi:hypothetical protein
VTAPDKSEALIRAAANGLDDAVARFPDELVEAAAMASARRRSLAGLLARLNADAPARRGLAPEPEL